MWRQEGWCCVVLLVGGNVAEACAYVGKVCGDVGSVVMRGEDDVTCREGGIFHLVEKLKVFPDC